MLGKWCFLWKTVSGLLLTTSLLNNPHVVDMIFSTLQVSKMKFWVPRCFARCYTVWKWRLATDPMAESHGIPDEKGERLSPAGLRVEQLLPTGTFTPCGWFCSTTWTCWAFSSECRKGHHPVPGAMNQVTVSSGGPIKHPKGCFWHIGCRLPSPGMSGF